MRSYYRLLEPSSKRTADPSYPLRSIIIFCINGESMGKIDWGEKRKRHFIEGLTLVEVMVGMLISAICLGTALQAYIGAVSIRAKSQQLNTAIAKMEADAENIRQMSKETTDCKGNYGQALMQKVVGEDTASTQTELASLQSVQSSQKSDSLASQKPDLSTPQSFVLPSSPDLPEQDQLTRKMEVTSDAPNVLKVSYTLTRPSVSESQQTSTPYAHAKEHVREEERADSKDRERTRFKTEFKTEEGADVEERITLAQLSLAVMPSAALLCP
jgi:Tfp pilus assembly protein PilE